TITVEIQTPSIYTDTGKLTDHLKTPDFFDVRTYPKATFVSTGIKPTTANGMTHEVTGNLTLHGVTKPITVPVKAKSDANGVTLDGTSTLQRLDFNINSGPQMVNNDVKVPITVRATRGGIFLPSPPRGGGAGGEGDEAPLTGASLPSATV